MPNGEHVVVVPEHDWWPVWVMASIAALLLAIAMLFALITSVQARERAERRDSTQVKQIECRAALNAAITASEQRADAASQHLLAEIVRQVVSQAEDPEGRQRLIAISDAADAEQEHTRKLTMDLEAYITAGSPLPCPLEVGDD